MNDNSRTDSTQLNLRMGRLLGEGLREGISRFRAQSASTQTLCAVLLWHIGRSWRKRAKALANSLTETSSPNGISTVAIGRAGLACTIVLGETALVTTPRGDNNRSTPNRHIR